MSLASCGSSSPPQITIGAARVYKLAGLVGRWGLSFDITPPGKAPFSVLIVDKATG